MGVNGLKDLYIPRTEIGMDYDSNPEGHLPSASCLPKEVSNDRAYIETKKIKIYNENALCAEFVSEVGGVISEKYTNCVTESGSIISIDKDGDRYSGYSTPEGRERLASVIAQTYDCYLQETEPNELARYLWENPSKIDAQKLSSLMRKYHPAIIETTLSVDIDQDAAGWYLPTVGAVTADPRMADDYIRLIPQETSNGLSICFMFDSELPEPYGNWSESCLLEDGGVAVYGESGANSIDNQERMLINMGTIINAYFSGTSKLSQEIVRGEKWLRSPKSTVSKDDQIEKLGLWDRFKKSQEEFATNCLENPQACP